MSDAKHGSIYIIENNVNDKVYVGLTRQPLHRRWWNHTGKARNLAQDDYSYLHLAMNKHGIENFSMRLLEVVPIDELGAAERKWIAFYKSNDKERGYNLTEGGEANLLSSESLAKMSRTKIGQNSGPSHYLWGKRIPAETMAKMIAAKTGVKTGPRSPDACRNISLGRLGKPLSLDHRRSVSETLKRNTDNTERLRAYAEARRGRPGSRLGAKHDPETRQRMSDGKRRARTMDMIYGPIWRSN